MILRKLIVSRLAKADMKEATVWYKSKSVAAGAEFITAVDRLLAEIHGAPERYPFVYQKMRRALVLGFPYAIFYVAEQGRIRILACMHDKRDPREWQARL